MPANPISIIAQLEVLGHCADRATRVSEKAKIGSARIAVDVVVVKPSNLSLGVDAES
jgi:hypothetical protein